MSKLFCIECNIPNDSFYEGHYSKSCENEIDQFKNIINLDDDYKLINQYLNPFHAEFFTKIMKAFTCLNKNKTCISSCRSDCKVFKDLAEHIKICTKFKICSCYLIIDEHNIFNNVCLKTKIMMRHFYKCKESYCMFCEVVSNNF
jgi:hypothetical protein